jgi:predicted transcriptional regulator
MRIRLAMRCRIGILKKEIKVIGMGKKMADALRVAIGKSGMPVNEIARKTGVPQPTISRFMAGADMRLSRAEIIAHFLGLELKGKR